MNQNFLSRLPASYRFWLAVAIITAYVLFGAISAYWDERFSTTIAMTVLSTLGPVVGMVVQSVFGIGGEENASGKPGDPVHVEEDTL